LARNRCGSGLASRCAARAALDLRAATSLKRTPGARKGKEKATPTISKRGELGVGLRRAASPRTLPRFTISSCDEDSERKLGVSRNGYLGFYKVAAATDPWLIEPVMVDGDVLVCRLKDHRGHVVKAELGTSDQYLNVETGTSLEFAIVHSPD